MQLYKHNYQYIIQVMKRVLIFGGYGNFGKIISRSFLKDKIPVIIAGRNFDKINSEKIKLENQFGNNLIASSHQDINDDLAQLLQKQKPSLLINTCGPFQKANYQVVENCIQAKVDYIDLADGRDFITNMHQYDEEAKKNGVTIITGASSVPGLSSAIIEQYKQQFETIDTVRYGISPGQKTTRGGIATVKGVLSYVGRPIRPYGNIKSPIYGWQDLYLQKYPQIGSRLMGNCQVPDLDIFPEYYGIKNVKFSAGMESKILHLGIWATSWLIRFGLPINLQKHAQFLLNFSHWGFDWMGTDSGGLHMEITGQDVAKKKIRRKWFIIVRKGQGPNVPVAPAIILGRKIVNNVIRLPGVNPCVGLVTLHQYLDQLSDFDCEVFTQKQYQ